MRGKIPSMGENKNEKIDQKADGDGLCRNKKRVGFMTLGCKVNQYETDAIAATFSEKDYAIVNFEEIADVYVINTCTVTNLSDRKSRQMIRKAKKTNPHSIVAVIGCYAQMSPDEVSAIEGVNIVMGTKDRLGLVNMIEEMHREPKPINSVGEILNNRIFEEMDLAVPTDRTRAYIKIQEGCSQFCSYCIIPYARGPVRSRQPEKILEEVKKLANQGYEEIVITGIHIASYGKDLENIDLLEILKLINEIDGINRIRIGSVEPQLITEEFVKVISKMSKLCPHFHISLQSGSDKILKAMNRKYTSNFYEKAVTILKENIEKVAITTDIMVGFPDESDEDFENTCKLAEKVGFADIHVFRFSPRKGTPAATFDNQVSGQIKDTRSDKLIELANKLRKQFIEKYLNKQMSVLVERELPDNKGTFEGFTENYIQVRIISEINLVGKIVDVNLKNGNNGQVFGELIF